MEVRTNEHRKNATPREALERVGTRGMLVELGSLLWSHPTAFVLFVMPGALLMGLGILFYLYSSRLPSRSTAQKPINQLNPPHHSR
jgi:hypothetical protein